ncbi:MAG: ribose 5-phosphate isomerase B [Clostridia bacterium]|nr:ribose 5-phosphate isomerase B [Clostridia bacterium]
MKTEKKILAIGCDHGGYELKEAIKSYLTANDIEFKDFGCDGESVNYPDYADKVCRAIQSGKCYRGILVCGTGIGMSMAANKHKGIRAACCSDTFSARMTRAHNDANVLCLGGRVVGFGLATDLVELFLKTEFEGGRHQVRVDMLTALDNNK